MTLHLRKSTRYALCAAMELAAVDDGKPITVAQIAELHGIPAAGLAKVFQALVRCGVAVGTRGVRGGYRLAHEATEVTLIDVIEAFQPIRSRDGAPPLSHPGSSRLQQVFREVDENTRCTFASVTLDMLVRPRSPGRGE